MADVRWTVVRKQEFLQHGADEDEARWDDRLKKVVKVKPAPEKMPKT